MHNSFGNHYRITTFGESHGPAIGVIIDGCPPGHQIDMQKVALELKRRRPGQSKITSPRDEADAPEVLSGIENGISLGTPITIIVRNTNVKAQDYGDMTTVFRPSHADYTSFVKYGIRPSSGGGRASARETIGRVAGAAIAEQILGHLFKGYQCVAWVDSVGDLKSTADDPTKVTRSKVDESIVRCPNTADANTMIKKIEEVRKSGDTIGGTISLCVSNLVAGIGEPIFDKLESSLAGAMMSLPATKGFEIGSGFSSTVMTGSEHNDEFFNNDGKITTKSNFSGGIQGGISNGQPITCRIAFKPVSTIFKEQRTIDDQGKETVLKPKAGRHDPCVVPRAVPMVEAMANLVILDLSLAQLARESAKGDHCRKL